MTKEKKESGKKTEEAVELEDKDLDKVAGGCDDTGECVYEGHR